MNEEALAQTLFAAQRERRLLDPPSDREPLGDDVAYRVQEILLGLHREAGAELSGYKVGFTSLAKQKQMGIDDPIFGFLTAAMELPVGSLPLAGTVQPRLEPEIAFRLGADLGGPDVGRADVIAASSEVIAALELLDSRYRDFRFNLADVVADNTSAAGYLLAASGLPADSVDLLAEAVEFSVGGGEPQRATGEAVQGDPAEAVAWLARRVPLRAGQLILSGGMTVATPVAAGDRVRATFSNLGEIDVRATAG